MKGDCLLNLTEIPIFQLLNLLNYALNLTFRHYKKNVPVWKYNQDRTYRKSTTQVT